MLNARSSRSLVWLAPAVLALILTACGAQGTTSGSTSTKDALVFSSSNVPVAYVGEPYTTQVQVAGGVGPYSVRLASGKLPDGLVLSGQTLSGKATKEGLYTFALEVADASLSTKVQSLNMTVTALPPLSLAFTLPASEIRGETRLPLVITAPRNTRAFRLQWALPDGVSVQSVAPVDTRAVAYWRVSGNTLTLDMGFRAGLQGGDRVALVAVRPARPVTLNAMRMGYTAYGADGKTLQVVALPAPPAPPAPVKPAAPTVAPATTAPATPPAGGTTAPGTQTAPVQPPPVQTSPVTPPAPPAPKDGK